MSVSNESNEMLALNALDKMILKWSGECASISADGGKYAERMVTLLKTDIDNVKSIRRYLLDGGNFYQAISWITDIDTAPREDILKAMQEIGLHDAIEETGLVKFAEKIYNPSDSAMTPARWVELVNMLDVAKSKAKNP